ncbi:MAG: hypothetical protein ABJG68_15680 [Crocinitomicaceae bacterium]
MSSYKFRVLIDTEKSEEIFRDIIISSTENFETFYQSILAAFEWSGQELASFYVSNESWDKGHEIALMDMQLSDSLDSPSIMKETIIQDLVSSSNQRFVLVYDFLRMWCFMIELIEVIQEDFEGPMLDLSVGIAPLEDSKEIDFSNDNFSGGSDLGNDIDDIFSEFSDDDDEFGGFENIDDMDI